jgi:predicted membrane-bound spermidine synthase
MTAVTTRPVQAELATYRHRATSGLVSIALASGLIAFWAAVILVSVSVTAGLVGIVIAIGAGLADAASNTPTAIAVEPTGITMRYWRRTRQFDATELVVTHNVPRDKFVVTRRGKRRSLMTFRERDSRGSGRAVRAFMAAGVEIVSA